ncbi:MAG: polysaccharide biosynthesis/export family protein, partial [Planctomycetaceae bacterium]|nr:polysaccharide biosynthesis/export family protein [Planctomycetaceae bacterium]
GQHLVRPDGTVGLGVYGSVYVTGMTLQEAKFAIEQHLCEHIHNPQVSVDVLAYNSKVYYVITDGGGAGEQVYRLPSTGNETVLDAIANVRGLPTVASRGSIWIARPAPESCRPDQVLPVDWNGIARGAQTCTNYQVLPGDRIYVKADKFITFDTNLSKITAPLERLFGFVILGNGTVRTLQRGANGFGTGNGF